LSTNFSNASSKASVYTKSYYIRSFLLVTG
jgi:hypothetical protein